MKLAFTLLFFLTAAVLSPAENWPAWRGPRGDGTSLEQNVPTHWSATSNVVWKTALLGEGHSSPIIWNDRLFLTTAVADTRERMLLCLERASGKLLWQQTVVQAPLEAKHADNSYASATPSTDGQRVYVTFLAEKDLVVAAYDFSGNQLWLVRPGQFYTQWGFCDYPILFEDKVIVVCDSKAENFVVALDRTSGRTLWKHKRSNPSQNYAAPLLRDLAGRPQLIIPGDKAVTSLEPRTGQMLWTADGPSEEFVATPVYNDKAGLVLACSSWPKRVLVAIKPDGNGNVSQTKVAWTNTDATPYVPSPVSVGDWFFTAAFANKEACCIEAATGKTLWREKAGLHHASPVAANQLVYFLNDDGVAHVVKAGPTFELVARNELGEKTFASPAISSGCLFLRSFKHVYCIAGKAR